MAAFTIKNIPEDLYQHLKTAANAHHRSINSELISCLERVLLPHKATPEDHILAARALRKRVRMAKIPTDEITDAKNEGRS